MGGSAQEGDEALSIRAGPGISKPHPYGMPADAASAHEGRGGEDPAVELQRTLDGRAMWTLATMCM